MCVSGELAQLGERLVCNQEVTGSSPVFSTSFPPRAARRNFELRTEDFELRSGHEEVGARASKASNVRVGLEREPKATRSSRTEWGEGAPRVSE